MSKEHLQGVGCAWNLVLDHKIAGHAEDGVYHTLIGIQAARIHTLISGTATHHKLFDTRGMHASVLYWHKIRVHPGQASAGRGRYNEVHGAHGSFGLAWS